MRDSQQGRCYAWERELGVLQTSETNPVLTEARAVAVVRHVWSRYVRNAASPSVAFTRTRRGFYEPSRHRVKLQQRPRLTTVLHETGHAIAGSKDGWHGPRFVRLMHELYEWFGFADRATMKEAAKKHRVKVAAVAYGPKPVKRRSKLAPSEGEGKKGTRNMAGENGTVELVALEVGFSGLATRSTPSKPVQLIHKVVDGKTLCGGDVTVVTPNMVAYKESWKKGKGDVSCARCLKALAKGKEQPKKAVAKSAAAKSKPSTPAERGRAYRARKKAESAGE